MNLAFSPSQAASAPLPPLLFEQILHSGTDYTRLTNADSIERKLEEIRRKRLPLTLHVNKDGKDYVFHSSIQSLHPGTQRAILTQLTPTSWRSLIKEQLHVTVSCYMPNGHLLFDSTIAPFANGETSLYCMMDFPAEMHKQQLRSSYRVSMQQHDAYLSLWVNEKKFSGKCLDLSVNGCCGEFSGELQQFLADAETSGALDDSRFTLQVALDDSALRFDTVARICRSKPQADGTLTLGINFVKTSSEWQHKLQQSLSVIQRMQLGYAAQGS